ncbi:MAG: 3-phosphoserine/phosphohydroxythreonine transaminase [Planctomycetota bacterium]
MAATGAADRVFNFSAGPAVLPVQVLEEVQREMVCLPGAGASLMELSHRGKVFVDIVESAVEDIRSLLRVPETHEVLFVQGGATLQFSMIPANLLRSQDAAAAYLITGSWGKKALTEARKEGEVDVVYDASSTNFNHAPGAGDFEVKEDAAYAYYCCNETIQGVQFQSEPQVPSDVPLVCDASSDLFSRPLDISKYGLIYACAQKNAGPAGATVVIIRKDLIDRGSDSLPGYLLYKNHANAGSMWNTPATFPIYVMGKVLKWIQSNFGDLESMRDHNEAKAKLLYDVLDANPDFYVGHADENARSRMNVTFNLPSDDQLQAFIGSAADAGLANLKGHRSVGGVRASVYNAMPIEGVEKLAQFMTDFASR